MRLLSAICLAFSLVIPTIHAFAQSDDQTFDELSADFLKGYFAANPISATGIGVHEYDNLLDDVGPATVDKEVARLKSFKAHLERLDPSSMSKDKGIHCRMLLETADERRFGYEQLR